MFCDSSKNRLEKILDILEKFPVDKNTDTVIIGDVDRFIDVVTQVKNRFDIKNRSVALLKMVGICEEFLKSEQEEVVHAGRP